MPNLFRKEVFKARGRRLSGDVICLAPLSHALLTGFIAASACGAFAWAAIGHYDRIERVPGLVVPSTGIAKVFADRPGTVTDVLVAEGAPVAAGQPLARISVQQVGGARQGLGDLGVATLSTQANLVAEQIAQAKRQGQLERARLDDLIATFKQELSALTAQSDLQRKIVASAQGSFAPLRAIVDRGYMSKVEFESRREAMLREEQSLNQIDQALAAKRAALSDAQAALAKLPDVTGSAVAALEGRAAELRQRRVETAFSQQAYLVTSPVTGRIAAVNTSAGRATISGRPLFTVIPDDGTLQAEVFAPSRAIGFVQPGQAVRVMYDAFPYQRFGSFKGRVVSVSRTVLAPDELDAPVKVGEPVYTLRVGLDETNVDAYGTKVPLQPGMTLVANVVLERRSFLDWILDPLRAVGGRS